MTRKKEDRIIDCKLNGLLDTGSKEKNTVKRIVSSLVCCLLLVGCSEQKSCAPAQTHETSVSSFEAGPTAGVSAAPTTQVSSSSRGKSGVSLYNAYRAWRDANPNAPTSEFFGE